MWYTIKYWYLRLFVSTPLGRVVWAAMVGATAGLTAAAVYLWMH